MTTIWRRPAGAEATELASETTTASSTLTSEVSDDVDVALLDHESHLDRLGCRTLGEHVHRRLEDVAELNRVLRKLEVVQLDLAVVEDLREGEE